MLMLLLGEKFGQPVWTQLDDDEIRQISIAMSHLGALETEAIEMFMIEFVGQMSASGAMMGNFDNTERLLQTYLPSDRVVQIMEEIRGPAGRNMWEKLSNVQDNVLANYLKNEYPQTVAVVLSKIRQEQSARVLVHPAGGVRARRRQPACCAWRACKRRSSSASSRRCGSSSCRTSTRRSAATRTSSSPRSSTPSTARPRRAS